VPIYDGGKKGKIAIPGGGRLVKSGNKRTGEKCMRLSISFSEEGRHFSQVGKLAVLTCAKPPKKKWAQMKGEDESRRVLDGQQEIGCTKEVGTMFTQERTMRTY